VNSFLLHNELVSAKATPAAKASFHNSKMLILEVTEFDLHNYILVNTETPCEVLSNINGYWVRKVFLSKTNKKKNSTATQIMSLTAERLRKSCSVVDNQNFSLPPLEPIWGTWRRRCFIWVSSESRGGRVASWSLWRFMALSPDLNCLLLRG